MQIENLRTFTDTQERMKETEELPPWVREVSDARRPSRKLMGERLCASLCWDVRAAMAGLAGRALKKGAGPTAELLAETPSQREGGSSSRLMSLCTEPMS